MASDVVNSPSRSLASSSSDLAAPDSEASLPAELRSERERNFAKLMELYEDKDTNVWSSQINDKFFKLWRTTPPGHTVHMQKMRVTMRASLQSVLDTTVDYERRTRWDTNLYDFRVLH